MGKHVKTSMDEKVIDYLAIELYKKDPENPILQKFLKMDNFEGTELQKTIRAFDKTCLLYTSPSPRDGLLSRMPSSA